MDENEMGAKLMRIARVRTRSWQSHAEYEDILAEAFFRAWHGYCRAQEKGMTYPFQIAARAAAWAPQEWLRRWGGDPRHGQRYHWQHVALQEADTVPVPGPEATVLAEMEREAAWDTLARGLARCTPYQRQVLYRLYLQGETPVQIAQSLSIHPAVIRKCRDRALARCRKAPPAPLRTAITYSHCPNGHEQSPANVRQTRVRGVVTGSRCRLCENQRHQESRQRARETASSQEGAS